MPEAFKVLMRELNALGIEVVALEPDVKEEEAPKLQADLIEESMQDKLISEQAYLEEDEKEATEEDAEPNLA